jgi:hypothetical protein
LPAVFLRILKHGLSLWWRHPYGIPDAHGPGSDRGAMDSHQSGLAGTERRRLTQAGNYPATSSNSPFRIPPRNAAHSHALNQSTGPPGFLLSRSATQSGAPATSTHWWYTLLSALFVQTRAGLDGLSAWPACAELCTSPSRVDAPHSSSYKECYIHYVE